MNRHAQLKWARNWLGVGVTLLGCAAGPSAQVDAALRRGQVAEAMRAYERAGEPNSDALSHIATVVLEREALASSERSREQAMVALAMAGTSAIPLLRHLAAVHGSQASGADSEANQRATTRVRALALLARLGDAQARVELRAKLNAADPQVVAWAVETLDPLSEVIELRERSGSPVEAIRAAAVSVLRRAESNPDTVLALARNARLDPASSVRAGALRALGRMGASAVESIEARLDDAESQVRMAAIGALVDADYAHAASRLERYLAAAPSAEGVEGARALLSADSERAPLSARTQLARALIHSEGALRSQAAVALMSLHEPRFEPLIVRRAPHEGARAIRLCLALALGTDHPQRRALLLGLMQPDDMSAAQAAAELALRGESAATRKLVALLHSKTPSIRSTVVRALAHGLGRVHDARSLLLDADTGVRVAAAAAILSAPKRSVR